jgi:hypothetical protein
MQCHETIGLFTRYRDGDLDAATRRQVESHLATCARCRDEFAALEAVVARLSEMSADPMPPDLVAAVHARVARRIERPSAVLLRWALPAAAAAVLVIVMFAVVRSPHEARPPGPVSRDMGALGKVDMRRVSSESLEATRKAAAAARERRLTSETPAGPTTGRLVAPRAAPREPAVGPSAPRAKQAFALTPKPAAPAVAEQAASPQRDTEVAPRAVAGGERIALSQDEARMKRILSARPPAPAAPPGPAGEALPSAAGQAGITTAPPPRPAAAASPAPQATAPDEAASQRRAAAEGVSVPPEATGTTSQVGESRKEQALILPESGVPSVMRRPGATAGPPGPATGRAYAPYSARPAPRALGMTRVALSAQATRSQQAVGNLTLQLRPNQDVERAQVAVRAPGVSTAHAVVWQGRLDGGVDNNLNIPVGPPAVALPANLPREIVVSGSTIAPQTYYLFPPAYPPRAPSAHPSRDRQVQVWRAETWGTVLQAAASRQQAYILAPAGFPLGQLVPADAQTSSQALGEALSRSGYRLTAQPGVITIEPSATLRTQPEPAPDPATRAPRARRWRR